RNNTSPAQGTGSSQPRFVYNKAGRETGMRLFKCQNCGQILYFENTKCESCGYALGYIPSRMTLSALEPQGDGFKGLAAPDRILRRCDNAAHNACNWLLDD